MCSNTKNAESKSQIRYLVLPVRWGMHISIRWLNLTCVMSCFFAFTPKSNDSSATIYVAWNGGREWGNQAQGRLLTTHGHSTDCKLTLLVHACVCGCSCDAFLRCLVEFIGTFNSSRKTCAKYFPYLRLASVLRFL